jgi:hypothetical protein
MMDAKSSVNFTDKVEAEYWLIQLKSQWVVLSSTLEDTGGWWVATVECQLKDGALVPVQRDNE